MSEPETEAKKKARPRRRRRRWPWLVLLLLIVGGYALARRRNAGPKDLDASLLVTVKKGDLEIEVVETGKVEPREKVEVKSKVAGQVERVFVEEGQKVKRGQLLLRLDTTDYRREVSRTDADVAQAKNGLEFAQLTLERKKRGLEARGVAQADVDLAQNDVKSRQVSLQTAGVAHDAALDRLHYCEIPSPMNGTVIARGVQPGEVVTPGVQATFEGKALLTVADLSQLLVRAELNQIDVAKVKLGQTVSVILDALPGKKYKGTITRIAPASVTPKGKDVDVFPVEATLSTVDDQIKPGMTADARIHIETRAGVLKLPIEALAKEKDKYIATRVTAIAPAQQTTEPIEVKVGARNDRELEVLSGLKEGDQVLIKPASSSENEAKF